MYSLDDVLRNLEKTEERVAQLEKYLKLLKSKNVNIFEKARNLYNQIIKNLATIDGYKPQELVVVSKIDILISEKEIENYRLLLMQKRQKIIHPKIFDIISDIDLILGTLYKQYPVNDENFETPVSPQDRFIKNKEENWQNLDGKFQQMGILLGSSIKDLSRWYDMKRHLSFGQICDFHDIYNSDWPSIKKELELSPRINDLSEIEKVDLSSPISTKLNWSNISESEFEELVKNLLESEQNYENTKLLMRTNAPDRGRDVSTYRVTKDIFSVIRQRVIVQCKHWLTKSVSQPDISILKDQMVLWGSVDILIIITTGYFTTDAVDFVERKNPETAMKIELVAGNSLESILASKPNLIARFKLR